MANLELGKFKPGQVTNPLGRPSLGLSFEEWCNVMQDWSQARLDACRNDPEQPAVKRGAAHQVSGMAEGRDNATDRCCDRTAGRPKSGDGDGASPVNVNVYQMSDDDIVRILTRRSAGRGALAAAQGTRELDCLR